jgi:hypothetical protein
MSGQHNRYFKYKNTYINKYNILSFEIKEEDKYKGHITVNLIGDRSLHFKYTSIVDLYRAASQLSGDYIDPINKDISDQAMPF